VDQAGTTLYRYTAYEYDYRYCSHLRLKDRTKSPGDLQNRITGLFNQR